MPLSKRGMYVPKRMRRLYGGRGMNIIVMCKDCGYETTVRGWTTGKNKYRCNCWGDEE
jgi:hypothetical protein